ncbi:MAG: hypothetical protein M1834_002849 [Cirrosporium novae-zelandiae]|nr:MAG: hypothetical protein M1834_002849 [Cirrosporium novae-zelandiae]
MDMIVQNWLRTRDRIAAQTLRAARDVEMANLLKVIDNLQAAVITTREEQKAMAVSYRERETITSAKSPFASPRGLAAQASS